MNIKKLESTIEKARKQGRITDEEVYKFYRGIIVEGGQLEQILIYYLSNGKHGHK